MKREWNSWDWMGYSINLFLAIFFLLYIGKFGLSDFIIPGDNKWALILNIGIWFVLVDYCINQWMKYEALRSARKK